MVRISLARVSCIVVPLLLLCGLASAQTTIDNSVHDVEICDLLKRPEFFDSQVIRFRGSLIFEFEGNHINDEPCELPILHRGIWWDYGGESILALPEEATRIRAMTSPIAKDAQFDLFESRAHDRLRLRPDGERCDSMRECAHYDVVATFRGRFFARRGGYGHMGCCHLFVIEQISDVSATATDVPSEDSKFTCAIETWQGECLLPTAPGFEGRLAANKQFLAAQMRNHGDESLIETMNRELSPYAGLTGSLRWSSPDLLKTYRVRFPERSRSKKVKKQPPAVLSAPVAVQVTREQCKILDN